MIDAIHAFERLRFRVLFGLSKDRARLRSLEAQVLQAHPSHPLVRNHRARLALPETELPPPPPEAAPVAVAFLEGRVEEALRLAQSLRQDRARVIEGDLHLLLDDRVAARSSFEQTGLRYLPPVQARLGRAMLEEAPERARRYALEALASNPLHGTARALLEDANARLDRLGPLSPPDVALRIRGHDLLLPKDATPEEHAIWSAWWRARQRALPEEAPPGAEAHRVLLAELERHPALDGPTLPALQTLQQLQALGLLEAYEWGRGLNRLNAAAFRLWRLQNPDTLLRYWRRD